MIEEIKKRLEAGEVVGLECVDEKGFIESDNSKFSETNGGILKSGLIVKSVNESIISFHGTHLSLYVDEFKYFRIKRPAPTFDDLIDVAVKAYKDGIADNLAIGYDSGIERVMLYVNGYAISCYQSSDISGHINHINSLYTETFVIENESDTNKLISGGKTVLKNGEVLEFSNNYKGTLYFNLNDYESDAFPFIALKGATVTQKRGKQ